MKIFRLRALVVGLAALSFIGGLVFFYTSPRAVARRERAASVEGDSAAPAPSEPSVEVVAQVVRTTQESGVSAATTGRLRRTNPALPERESPPQYPRSARGSTSKRFFRSLIRLHLAHGTSQRSASSIQRPV